METSVALEIIRMNFIGDISSIFSNYGSFIQIDYMNTESKAQTGIFVYLSNWILQKSSCTLLKSSFTSRNRANSIFKDVLTAEKSIVDITFKIEKQEFVILFKNNISLNIYPDDIYSSEDMINFFIDDGRVLCYSTEKHFYLSQ